MEENGGDLDSRSDDRVGHDCWILPDGSVNNKFNRTSTAEGMVTEVVAATTSDLKVGFIGLGNMGAPMATNIARAGFDLTVFDRREEAMLALMEHGAKRIESVAQMAATVDVLCSCVLYDHQINEIFSGDDGIIANARPGLVCTIHSTVLPETVVEVAVQAQKAGIHVIDAPVSGASIASKAGTLTVMVGGSEDAISVASPVLAAVGRNIIRVGDAGMGQVAKLANNIMSMGNQVVAMEAVRFAESFGLEKDRLFEVAEVSTGASWAASNYSHFDRYGVEHTLAGTDELPHRLGKDLRYAVTVAQDRWTYLPVVAVCSQVLPAMFAERWQRNAAELADGTGGEDAG
jgi:3-hydroxyisobutyrate dehydrogenase